jgi:hypothetical protein
MLLLSTYLLRSGELHGGQTRRDAVAESAQLQSSFFFLQLPHTGIPATNPSLRDLPPIYFPKPSPTPKKRTKRARIILGVTFIGITDAIRPFYMCPYFLRPPARPVHRRASNLLRKPRIIMSCCTSTYHLCIPSPAKVGTYLCTWCEAAEIARVETHTLQSII